MLKRYIQSVFCVFESGCLRAKSLIVSVFNGCVAFVYVFVFVFVFVTTAFVYCLVTLYVASAAVFVLVCVKKSFSFFFTTGQVPEARFLGSQAVIGPLREAYERNLFRWWVLKSPITNSILLSFRVFVFFKQHFFFCVLKYCRYLFLFLSSEFCTDTSYTTAAGSSSRSTSCSQAGTEAKAQD